MLLQLTIRNFAIVKSLDIDWRSGMTTITGETGAGKSIAIDALGLCLGDRATTNVVRPGSKQAELTVSFDVDNNKPAQRWLKSHDFQLEDGCILRRVISAEGRSRSYINGTPVPLTQLKEIGQLLINIHGQHDHQLITKVTTQRNMLDDYSNHKHLLDDVKFHYQKVQSLSHELQQLQDSQLQRAAEQQLLAYQVSELDEFNLAENEFEQLEIEYKKFSNHQHLLDNSLRSIQLLSEDEQFNISDSLRQVSDLVAELAGVDDTLAPYLEQLTDAVAQVDDVSVELRNYAEKLDLDPEQFQLIEDRYSTAIQLSKKHQVAPEDIPNLHAELTKQANNFKSDESRLSVLHQEIENAKAKYLDAAKQLTDSRLNSAKKLSKEITKSMRELNMEHGQFNIDVATDFASKMTSFGCDDIHFKVSLNPGQQLEMMSKVASGGELSRISLAMQVILSKRITTPSLIFDEVDVGISGPTAARVGEKLNQLAKQTQVICVTHLPQVASKGDQQLFVSKLTDGSHTETTVTELSSKARVKEIARLLAGDKITSSSLANAEELLAS